MGQACIIFDHRGSSAPGDAPEPTRLRAGRRPSLPIFVSRYKGILNIDKFLPKHYNIYKYNTKGKRRSAHHPKGGVKYVRIDYCAYSCAEAGSKVDNYHIQTEITALLISGRLFPK